MSLARARNDAVDLAILEPIATKFARSIQGIIGSGAGDNIQMAAGTANAVRFPEWRIAQNPFGALLRFQLSSSGDDALVHLPGYLIGQIVDLHYGGYGTGPTRTEFTAAELRFVSRLGDRIAPALASSLGGGELSQIRFIDTHTDLLYASWPKSRDAIVVQPVTCEGGAIKPAIISLVLAAETVRSLSERHTTDTTNGAPTDALWAERMRVAAMGVRMRARAVLTRTDIDIQRLLTLAPGDVLPLLLPAQIPLTVEGRKFAYGTLGEANGRAALLIEKIEKETDQ